MRALVLGIAALGWACDAGFPSRSLIEDYRLIGIEADAPELPPDGQVQLRAWDLEPTGAPVRYRWSVCLRSLGAVAGYACADPAFEIAVDGDGPTIAVDFGPQGIDFKAFYASQGPTFDAAGRPLSLADGVDVQVRLSAEPEGGAPVAAVKRLHLRADADAPNTNPTIDALAEESADADGRTLRVTLAPGAAEAFTDPLTGAARTESLLFTWYTTAGRLDPPLAVDAPTTRLILADDAGPAQVFVAVRDGRGGLAVAELRVASRR